VDIYSIGVSIVFGLSNYYDLFDLAISNNKAMTADRWWQQISRCTPLPNIYRQTDKRDDKYSIIWVSIVLGSALLVAGVYFLLQASLSTVEKNANQLDNRKTSQAVQAAIDSSLTSMSGLVKTNSVWDDAVTKIYRSKLDQAWLYSSIGSLVLDEYVRRPS
jgi:hypothetical protein